MIEYYVCRIQYLQVNCPNFNPCVVLESLEAHKTFHHGILVDCQEIPLQYSHRTNITVFSNILILFKRKTMLASSKVIPKVEFIVSIAHWAFVQETNSKSFCCQPCLNFKKISLVMAVGIVYVYEKNWWWIIRLREN